MAMTVDYKPYTGAIDTSSARYKRAKAMYDEGHPNGETHKSDAEVKNEKALQNLKMIKQMLGQKYDDLDLKIHLKQTKKHLFVIIWGFLMRTAIS